MIKFKLPNRDWDAWVETNLNDLGINIEKKEWRSKYDSYAVYDYEPFCLDGFEIWYTISGDPSFIAYFRYLFKNRKEDIKLLKTCYEDSKTKGKPKGEVRR